MKTTKKQISSPFSTGGGGFNFETRVQAAFTVLMLTGGFSPCPPLWPIVKLKLQGKFAGFDTDDMVVYRKELGGDRESRILAQIKHSITISKGDSTFSEVIQAAWSDFNNPKVFRFGIDSIALVTGPLTCTDMEVRTILEWARHCEDAREFVTRVNQAKISSSTKKAKLAAFRHHLKLANGGVDVPEDQLWEFMKSFHLLGYDLDIQSGVIHSLMHSLIGFYAKDNFEGIWASVVVEVQAANQNAGTITMESLPGELCVHFKKKGAESFPSALAKKPAPSVIDWGTKPLSELATATLLGGWDESTAGDAVIVAEVAKESYASWMLKVHEALQDPECPLMLRNGVWTVSSKGELWQALGSRIFDGDLDVFQTAAVSVLSAPDPLFELPSDERYMARVKGKVLPYSPALRKGMSDTLALLGSRPKALIYCSKGKAESVAFRVVQKIFDEADWVLWGSLNDLLPRLAEAAPNAFLDAVENALQNLPSPFAKLFEEEGSGITGGNYLTGLLWALESLAWDADFLSQVAVILGELSTMDPGGNWANRPKNSLTTIFLPWLPQTTAPADRRYAAVRTLKQQVPASAWPLLLSLLPHQSQMSSGAFKPVWRLTIPENWEKGVTRAEYWEQVSFYAELALDMAKADIGKLPKLIELMDSLPPPAISNLMAHILSSAIEGLPEEQRMPVWNALTELTARHRRFSNAEWSLEPSMVAEIEAAAERLAPQNLILLHRRLFSDQAFDLYESDGDWKQEEEKIEKRRIDAVFAIFDFGGIDSVLQLAEKAASPLQVGVSLGVIAPPHIDETVLPRFLNDDDGMLAQFAKGFIWARNRKHGWNWADEIDMSHWTVSQMGRFLACLPFCSETWRRVGEKLGANDEEYWGKVAINPFQPEGCLGSVIEKLLEHGRPNAALECLYAEHHEKRPLDVSQTAKALLMAVSTSEKPNLMRVHHAVDLIKVLQDDVRTDPEDLYKIEWLYLSALDGHRGASPKLLEQRLASDPKFFCEIIRFLFRSKNSDGKERAISDAEKNLASNAFKLLHEWRTPPGILQNGQFSPEHMIVWLKAVKSECGESGHLEVALSQIGQVLIYAPQDPCGLWVHKAVAEVLNAKDAEDMRHGFSIGVFNSRGVHWVDPAATPEKELTAKYRQYAADVETYGFQRLATSMREIAESYSRQAERIIDEFGERTVE